MPLFTNINCSSCVVIWSCLYLWLTSFSCGQSYMDNLKILPKQHKKPKPKTTKTNKQKTVNALDIPSFSVYNLTCTTCCSRVLLKGPVTLENMYGMTEVYLISQTWWCCACKHTWLFCLCLNLSFYITPPSLSGFPVHVSLMFCALITLHWIISPVLYISWQTGFSPSWIHWCRN